MACVDLTASMLPVSHLSHIHQHENVAGTMLRQTTSSDMIRSGLGDLDHHCDLISCGHLINLIGPSAHERLAPLLTHKPNSVLPCRHFQMGRCRFGAACRFRHSEGSPTGPPPSNGPFGNAPSPGPGGLYLSPRDSATLAALSGSFLGPGLPARSVCCQRVTAACRLNNQCGPLPALTCSGVLPNLCF